MRVAICILFFRKALASEASWVAKKIWLLIHPQNFGSHAHPSAPQGNQCDLPHFPLVWELHRRKTSDWSTRDHVTLPNSKWRQYLHRLFIPVERRLIAA